MNNTKFSDNKINKLANEIITAVEFYLGGVEPILAKDMIKYGDYCIPYMKDDKIQIPSDKLKKIHNELCELMVVDEFKIKDIGREIELKVMPLVQDYFNFDIADGCIWRGGLALHLFKLKAKNNI